MIENNEELLNRIKKKTFYSWIPTITGSLNFRKLTKDIVFDNFNKASIDCPNKNTCIIKTIYLNDSIISQNNQLNLPFDFKIILSNQDQLKMCGNITMTVSGIASDKSKVEGLFNIDKQGFIEISIINIIHTDSKPLEIEDSFFHRILYTIIKILMHDDAHHQQKVDNVVGIFDTQETYKIDILKNMIDYLKTIETTIKNYFDNTKFGYDYLKKNEILDKCARFEGFVSYIYSYLNLMDISTEEHTKYINSINPILLSVRSFKLRLEAGNHSSQFEKTIGTGVAMMISSGILLTNLTEKTSFFTTFTKFEFFSIILVFTCMAAGFIYFRTLNLYYILFNMSDISKEIKYATSLKKHSTQVYKDKVSLKVKILLVILQYGELTLYILANLWIIYLIKIT